MNLDESLALIQLDVDASIPRDTQSTDLFAVWQNAAATMILGLRQRLTFVETTQHTYYDAVGEHRKAQAEVEKLKAEVERVSKQLVIWRRRAGLQR